MRGQQTRSCSAGVWAEWGACDDPDECTNGEETTRTCGRNDRGTAPVSCVDGELRYGRCADPDECVDGETGTGACGPDGAHVREHVCVEGRWGSWGECVPPCEDGEREERGACGFNARGSSYRLCDGGVWGAPVCIDSDECRNGSSETITCGLNGRGAARRTCVDGQWDTADCADPDECTDGTVVGEPCGVNGRGTLGTVCREGSWDSTAECVDPDECADGASETLDGCGFNGRGTQTRQCVAGAWGAPTECADPDECEDLALDQRFCGLNFRGIASRRCTAGTWSEFVCVDPDVCVDGTTAPNACPWAAPPTRACVSGAWDDRACTPPLEPARSSDVRLSVDRIAVGDVDRDGFPDLISGSHVFGGRGDGRFAWAYEDTTSAASGRGQITAASGAIEYGTLRSPSGPISYGVFDQSDRLFALLRGSPDLWTVSVAGTGSTSGGRNSMGVLDVNGDGIDEFIIQGSSYTLLSFTSPTNMAVERTFSPGSGLTYGLVPVDVNGDRFDDLLVKNTSGTISVMMGTGDGRFDNPVAWNAGEWGAATVVHDFDEDELDEVVVVNVPSGLRVLNHGVASQTFSTNWGVTEWQRINAIAVDLDHDGDDDLAVVTPGKAWFFLYEAGAFQAPVEFAAPVTADSPNVQPMLLRAFDLEGDGNLDIVALCGRHLYLISDSAAEPMPSAWEVGTRANHYDGNMVFAEDLDGDGSLDLRIINWIGGLSNGYRTTFRTTHDGYLDWYLYGTASSGTFHPVAGPGRATWIRRHPADSFDPAWDAVERLNFAGRSFTASGEYGLLPAAMYDLEGDGVADVAGALSGGSAGWDGQTIVAGRSAATYRMADSRVSAIAMADVTGDGRPDLVAIDSSGTVRYRAGAADGEFGLLVVLGSAGSTPNANSRPVVYDADDDGNDEILFLSSTRGWTVLDVTPEAPTPVATTAFPSSPTARVMAGPMDLDGDGVDEFAWVDSTGVRVVAWDAGRASREPARVSISGTSTSIAFGDLNNDGADDIVVEISGTPFRLMGVLRP